MNEFVSGAIAMGYALAGVFFVRFWTRTRDRLFMMFALAFWLLGIARIGMTLLSAPDEHHYWFWLRFAAYLLILLAILDKNRGH